MGANPVRIIDPGTAGSGVRVRELIPISPWLVVFGRLLWWLVIHPPVVIITAGALALGYLGRSWWIVGAGVAGGLFLALLAWFGWVAWRGSATGVWPILRGMSRMVTVKRRWPRVADRVGYSSSEDAGKMVPPLKAVTITQTGVRANVITGAVVKGPKGLVTKSPDIAAGMFCDRVRVRPTQSWAADITFDWGRHLAQEYRLHDIPAANNIPGQWPARVSFGITEEGGPAELIANLSVLVGGASGSGKSTAAWSILAAYIAAGVPIRVNVLDPGVLEFAALKKQLDSGKPGICHQYVTKFSEVKQFWADSRRRFEARMADVEKSGVRVHVPTPEHPMDIMVIDELLPYASSIGKGQGSGIDHIVGETAYLGRKFGFMVIACSQLSQVDSIGRIRDLFPQRVAYRTLNRYMTDAVLGDGAEAEGAQASDIDIADPGVCYLKVPGVRNYVAARSAKVTDSDTKVIATGRLPEASPVNIKLAERQDKPTAVYRLYYRLADGTGLLLYVGISNLWIRRMEQHEADKPWYSQVDVELTEVLEYQDRMLAETAEALAIQQERPLFNEVFNEKNPFRVDWKKLGPLSPDEWRQVIERQARMMGRAA